MLTFIDLSQLENIRNNIYYLESESLYYRIKNNYVLECWTEYYDDFNEPTRKVLDIKYGISVLIDLNIGFE